MVDFDRQPAKAPTSSRAVTASIFFLIAAAWALFVQSALQQKSLSWFPLLLGCRLALCAGALILGIASLWIQAKNALLNYLSVCILVQATFACLEPANQLEYYQYVSYFVLLASFTFKRDFRSWLRRIAPLHGLALAIPLFFKNPDYFKSVGIFAFQFTTPISLAFLAVIIARVSSDKFRALNENLRLQSQILQMSESAKAHLEEELKVARGEIEENAKRAAAIEVALKTAHNIRSPLSALEIKLQSVEISPTEKRSDLLKSIQRIKDIANDLVSMGRSPKLVSGNIRNAARGEKKQILREVHIPSLVESVTSEKRIEYQGLREVSIELNIAASSYPFFALIDEPELRQVLSNLINNSIESFKGSIGRVSIGLDKGKEDGLLEIIVEDNGHGISTQALASFGVEPITVGKEQGLGLGLFHAKKAVEQMGGRIRLERLEETGSRCTITLPQIETPKWFAESIDLKGTTTSVTIDDDEGFRSSWASRLPTLKNVSLDPGQTKNLVTHVGSLAQKGTHFFVDMDINDSDLTGLDLIHRADISEKSTLVTSHFDNERVQASVMKLGVKIVPKQFSHLVRVSL